MHHSLVVIDCQPIFRAARDKQLIQGCLQEIYSANINKVHILFVEYWWQNYPIESLQTYPVLTSAAKDFSIIQKFQQNGSDEIRRFYLKKFGEIPPLRITGVNTEMCVLDTVKGLSKCSNNGIVVVEKACNSEANHKAGLRLMSKMSNVFLG